ncbi:DUF4349 domain-containing protein [Dawidia soli]|uniref:DUF4349 domain-containing protein n=1 Tax=Dawidia soli TaxID=2782352 RepID=A0AAP2DFX1_9BACT|nr:DUF4349 domain-containing protein [Dawidia soli]MBT1690356.1 DUF4349 domain-containing protein [Dawidia soli]
MQKLITVLCVAGLCSCASKNAEMSSADAFSDTAAGQPATEVAQTTPTGRPASQQAAPALAFSDPHQGNTRLVKKLHYRFEVADIKKSTEAIEAALKKYPAYMESSNLRTDYQLVENHVVLRVQNEYFHELLTDIDVQALAVEFRNVSTEDVSKDFVDLESRIRTKREVEERYRDILRRKAGTIEELLETEKQIGILHEEIEAAISRVNYLREQVNYSTLKLELYQHIQPTVAIEQTPGWGEQFYDAFSTGLQGVAKLLLGLVYIWPLLLVVAIAAGIVMFLKRKGRVSF